MAILFVGTEDIDFIRTGSQIVSSDPATFRTAYSRCALSLQPNGMLQADFAASSRFWFGMRASTGGTIQVKPLLTFFDTTSKRFFFQGETTGQISLVVVGASNVETKVATTALSGFTARITPYTSTLIKYDVFVDYTAGRVKLYGFNNELLIDYTGSLTLGGSTTLSGFAINNPGSSILSASEVIVSTTSTQLSSLYTLVPTEVSSKGNFTGTLADITERTLSDTTFVSSATEGDELGLPLANIPTTEFVVAVGVSARMQSDGTAPSNAAFGIVGGMPLSSPVGTGLATRRTIYERNPAENTPWTPAGVNAAAARLIVGTRGPGDSAFATEDGQSLTYEDGAPIGLEG